MTQRRTDVDLVRFLALVSMYVAHVAPVSGPLRVLELSEYLTMPLFALLVGVGAQLGAWSEGSVAQRCWSVAVRASVLVLLGLALERAGAQVVVVLAHLGALVVVAALLALLPAALMVGAGVSALVAGVRLDGPDPTAASGWVAEVEWFLWAGGPYRLLDMVVYAALGILWARWWLRRGAAAPSWAPGVVGVGLLVVAAAMLGAEQVGRIDLVPYTGTVQEIALNCLLASGVLGVGLALDRVLAAARPGRAVLRVLAAAGTMTLTLYALQVLWLALDVQVLRPGRSDDSWTNLVVLLVGSVAIAGAWTAAVPRGVWRRGPLEGATQQVLRFVH